MIEVKVPDIGDFDGVEVIEIMVKPGDQISIDDSLITVESDKASMEIPAAAGGIVKEIKVALGDHVSEGDVILMLEALAESAQTGQNEKAAETDTAIKLPPSPNQPQPEPVPAEPDRSTIPPPPEPKKSPTAHIDPVKFKRAHASPSVRKFARELGADLGLMKGSGKNGRIVKQDVQQFIKEALKVKSTTPGAASLGVEPMPQIDFSQWGEVETVPLSKINVLTGKFLHRNWVNIPHVTQFDEADITALEEFRKQANQKYADEGFKLTMVSFLLKAVALALKKYPRFNSSLSPDGQNLIRKHYCHIGVAVATPDGLVVPVIRDVDQKSLSDLARDLSSAAKKAREKKLSPSDMQGGCFSISSLGGIGGTAFTPIVNAPEVAILGVSKAKMQPVWDGNVFQPRLICPLSLSYDHRVIDGAEGAAFTSYLSALLSDIRHLLI